MEKCGLCDISLKDLLISFDNGINKYILCPNHVVSYRIGTNSLSDVNPYPTEFHEESECLVCKNKEKIWRYKTNNNNGKTLVIDLCEHHLYQLMELNLSPEAYKIIKDRFGIFHEIHEDFYTYDGNALQALKMR